MESEAKEALKVLLMDDDRAVLDIGARLLEHLGCRVTAVESGEQAVEAFREEFAAGDCYDLVVLDINVPGGLGGEGTLTVLREIDPRVPVLASTGYSDSQSVKSYKQFGFAGCISKPYTLEQLKHEISRAVEDQQ
jgi:CheY-like chemotaxis protein